MSGAPLPTWDHPVVLEGRFVRLEPIATQHADGLLAVGGDPTIWRWMPRGPLLSVADALDYIRDASRPSRDGPQLTFACIERRSGRVAGSSRLFDLRPEHCTLEIGWTWLGVAFQRTALNTEMKLLMLKHAFDSLGALRVQFKTDHENIPSQRALERIGAVREGVLRAHRIRPDGSRRDSVYFSILAGEWSAVRQRLAARLDQPPA